MASGKQDLLVAYAAAQSQLVRLEERTRLSPVRSVLRVRAEIAERQALARIDGMPLLSDDIEVDGRRRVGTSGFDLSLGRQSIGVPISLNALMGNAPALLAWLGIDLDSPSAAPGVEDMLHRVRSWQRAAIHWLDCPPLLASAHLAASWRLHAPLGRSDLAASLLVGDRWGPGRYRGSQGGLIATGLELEQNAWRVAQDAALERYWLDAIARGAEMHLNIELRLRNYAARARRLVDSRRRPGRLGDLLHLAMIQPRVTSKMVAQTLGLTSAGAINLLTIAADAGLLIERSGQSNYRSYAIPVAFSLDLSRPRADPLAAGYDALSDSEYEGWNPDDG